eukprot:8343408-Pyramimonas_sp.AAC.1
MASAVRIVVVVVPDASPDCGPARSTPPPRRVALPSWGLQTSQVDIRRSLRGPPEAFVLGVHIPANSMS